MYVLPLLNVVVGEVTLEGSELLLGLKNHSKVGEGTSEGKGTESGWRVVEHISEKVPPAVPVEPEGEMVTGGTLKSIPKFTVMVE